MIVDTHTHLWHSVDQLGPAISANLRQRYVDLPEHLEASDQAHEQATETADVTFVLGFRSILLGADVPAEQVSAYVRARPDRRIGFAGIDPLQEDHLEVLDRFSSLQLSGVVISPSEQGFHPSHSAAMALYEKCESLGLPLFFHQGVFSVRDSMMEYAQPYLLDEVARTFPKLKMILARVGMPFVEQTLALLGKHANVYAELSGLTTRPWNLYNTLLQAHQCGATERLLFASGFPAQRPDQAAEAIYSIIRFTQGVALPAVPREKLRGIVERDALACLGLKRGTVPEGDAQETHAEKSTAAAASQDENS